MSLPVFSLEAIAEAIVGILFMWFLWDKLMSVFKWVYDKIYTILWGERIVTESKFYDARRWERYEIK